ncbi:MAG: lysostaphin resistance A-like protein [Phormidesmis sp.]
MSHPFIELAHQGKNQGWRYFVGSLLALFTFLIPGGFISFRLLLAYVQLDGNPDTRLLPVSEYIPGELPVTGVSPLVLYVIYNLAFPFFLLGIYWAVRYLHGRSLHTLITPFRRISWLRVGQGFGVFFILKAIEIFVSYGVAPEDFTLNVFQPKVFFSFLAWVLVLTPLQIAAEELFCRGYLLQGMGSKFGKWMAVLLTTILFTALHGYNPEVSSQGNLEGTLSILLYYFMVGAFLGWLTIKDKTIELALGVHAANNIATFIFVTSPNSAIPSPAIFTIADIEANFTALFFTALLLFAFAVIVFKGLKQPSRAI